MTFRSRAGLLLGGLLCASAPPALAHPSPGGPSLQLEIASEERRRGLGWSEGDPVLRASASLQATDTLLLEAAATTLWGSARHGGADAAIDLGVRYRQQAGAVRLEALGSYHAFPGASSMGYAEIGADLGYMVGPAEITLFSRYAPEQSAIGGDNLVLGSALAIGLARTPFSLSAHIARSSGSRTDAARAARLRPGGSYRDHGVALHYHRGRWSAGLHYSDSSIARAAARHAGPSLIARIGLSL